MAGPMPTSDDRAVREHLYSLIDWTDVHALLDIGCGGGYDLQAMGQRAPDQACLVGVDSRPQALDIARSKAQPDQHIAFSLVDVARGLPFDNERFDVVFCKDMLECLTDKAAFLKEVHRVLRPHGRVMCAHWDWDSQLIDGEDKALVRKIVQAYGDWQQDWMADCDAWMGRRLWRTFQRSGLFQGEVFPYVLTNTQFEPGNFGWDRIHDFEALVRRGLIVQEEYDAFYMAIAQLASHGEYFYSVTMYAYVGKKI